jgi:hypothetical protein
MITPLVHPSSGTPLERSRSFSEDHIRFRAIETRPRHHPSRNSWVTAAYFLRLYFIVLSYSYTAYTVNQNLANLPLWHVYNANELAYCRYLKRLVYTIKDI